MANAKDTGFRSRWEIIENERLLLVAIKNINDAQYGSEANQSLALSCAMVVYDRIIAERPNASLEKGK